MGTQDTKDIITALDRILHPPERYCVGLMFSPGMGRVVLIRKNRPEWQVGKLNGVGGRLEGGESPLKGMVREFKEETGVRQENWNFFALLKFPNALMWCFWATGEAYYQAYTQTDEKIETFDVKEVMVCDEVVSNLPWLIQMALSFERGETARSFVVTEEH